MDTTVTSAFDLLKQIPVDLFQLDETPLMGFAPDFPLNKVGEQLANTLQVEAIQLEEDSFQWRSAEELFTGLGDKLQAIHLNLPPLTGSIYWVMSEKDILTIMSALLLKQSTLSEPVDKEFIQAFYQFLAIETCNAIEKNDFDKKLSFEILEDNALPAGNALTKDVTISFGEIHVHGRLILTPEFRSSWQKRYSQPPKDYYLTSPLSEKIQVIVHLEAGTAQLKMSEWKQVQLGDFIVLDSCSLDAGEDKGRVMLTVNDIPFFRGRIKQGSIKILEHPLYHEVNTLMNKNPDDEDADDLSEDFDEEFDEDDDLESEIDEETDLDEESETETDIDHDEDEDFSDLDEESGIEHDEEDEPKQKAEKKPSGSPKQEKAEAAAAKPAPKPASGTSTATVEEIPLSVVVEVGRLQMSVKKLMELQPGNMLELDIHPESGVDLVVNGKRIAKGELLRIGEALGVRILELT